MIWQVNRFLSGVETPRVDILCGVDSSRSLLYHAATLATDAPLDRDAQRYIRLAQWTQQQYGDTRHHRKRLASLLLDDIAA